MKTVCIYHGVDLDGWMSAAIVKHWFNQQEIPTARRYCSVCKHILPDDWVGSTSCCGSITTTDNNTLDFIGYNYGQSIPDLSEYGKVIMVDISFPKEEMIKLWDKLGVDNMIWIDHHISAIKDIQDTKWLWEGRQDTNFAACELTWQYFFPDKPMPEIVRLLGRYDCFGSRGTDEETTVLEFQYGARECISNYKDAYNYLHNCLLQEKLNAIENSIWRNGKSIYAYLCTEAKQAYKNGFPIEFIGGKDNSVAHTEKKFICINKERFNPINFGIDYHKDGYDGAACFHYDGKVWKWSLYNDNGLVDCSIIAKQYGGGGHQGASGFILNNEQFLTFINNK